MKIKKFNEKMKIIENLVGALQEILQILALIIYQEEGQETLLL